MSPSPSGRPRTSPVVAGSLIVAPMALFAAIGFGLGSLVGAAAPVGIAGLFAGLVVGFVLVIQRFRDI